MLRMIIGAIVIYAFFFGACYLGTGGDKKNMISYYSYPDEVQQKIKEDEKLKDMIPAKKSPLMTNLSNVILFTVVFVILGIVIQLRDFGNSLIYFLIVGAGLNLFDLLIIDGLWWRNSDRTKFSILPEKSYYMDMKKHVGAFKRGIPVFAVCAILSAGIIALVF